eukprot:g7581.t1
MSRATPEMIAAAWAAWHSRHGGKLGPGPAFVEAINAALKKMQEQTAMTIDSIKAALAAGPTPGPWHSAEGTATGRSVIAPQQPKVRLNVAHVGGAQKRDANADFIAACNPAAISELISTLEEQQKRIAELEEALSHSPVEQTPAPVGDVEPVAWTWKHPTEGEQHRKYSRHHPGFTAESTYVVKPLYDHAPAPQDHVTGPIAWRYRHVPTVGWSYSDSKHPREDLEQEPLYGPETVGLLREALARMENCCEQLAATRLSGEFCVTWDDADGIRRRYRLGTADKAEATRLATSRYAELTRPRGTTVADLWRGYLLDMEGRAVVGTMSHTWKALEKRFGGMDAESISVADCRAHAAERRAIRTPRHPNGIQDGTIHTELGHLRMVLLWAKKNKLIADAPHIERPAKPEPKDAHLTRDEVRGLIDAAKAPHVALAIRLMIGTGARNEAALQLTWDRVDFERRMIRLRNPFDKSRRKGRATVPINDTLFSALEEAHKASSTNYVVEWAGEPIKSIKKGLKAAGTSIGRPDVSPHMLRHSAAVWMAEDGHDMHEISQYLGHDDVKTTMRIYARFSPTHLRKLADSLNAEEPPLPPKAWASLSTILRAGDALGRDSALAALTVFTRRMLAARDWAWGDKDCGDKGCDTCEADFAV